MSLFESTITGNILNDGGTTEISGITAGQLATVLTAYTGQHRGHRNQHCRGGRERRSGRLPAGPGGGAARPP